MATEVNRGDDEPCHSAAISKPADSTNCGLLDKKEEEVIVSEFQKKVEDCDDEDRREEKEKHQGLSSTPSSDEEGGGGAEDKKGLLDKIKEKLHGGKKVEGVESPPPTPVAAAHVPEADEDKDKNGLLEKIREKIPVLHSNQEEKDKEKGKSSFTG